MIGGGRPFLFLIKSPMVPPDEKQKSYCRIGESCRVMVSAVHWYLTEKEYGIQSSRRRFNSPTPTRRRVKSSRDVVDNLLQDKHIEK